MNKPIPRADIRWADYRESPEQAVGLARKHGYEYVSLSGSLYHIPRTVFRAPTLLGETSKLIEPDTLLKPKEAPVMDFVPNDKIHFVRSSLIVKKDYEEAIAAGKTHIDRAGVLYKIVYNPDDGRPLGDRLGPTSDFTESDPAEARRLRSLQDERAAYQEALDARLAKAARQNRFKELRASASIAALAGLTSIDSALAAEEHAAWAFDVGTALAERLAQAEAKEQKEINQ